MAMPVLYIAQPYTDIRMLDVRATSYCSYIVIDILHMYRAYYRLLEFDS